MLLDTGELAYGPTITNYRIYPLNTTFDLVSLGDVFGSFIIKSNIAAKQKKSEIQICFQMIDGKDLGDSNLMNSSERSKKIL